MLKVKPLFTAFPTSDVNDTSFPIWRIVANGVKGESVRAILLQKKKGTRTKIRKNSALFAYDLAFFHNKIHGPLDVFP